MPMYQGWQFNALCDSTEHEGYDILRKWCLLSGGECSTSESVDSCESARVKRQRTVERPASESNQAQGEYAERYFLYTSNIDGHFRRGGRFPSQRLYEIHGCNLDWQCGRVKLQEGEEPSAPSIFTGDPCCDTVVSVPDDFRFVVSTDSEGVPVAPADARPLRGFGSNRPLCTHCGAPARPNAVFFDDSGFVRSPRAARVESAYLQWVRETCARCAAGDASLLVLELGCGTFVPSVRSHIDCVMGDIYPSSSNTSCGSGGADEGCSVWPAADNAVDTLQRNGSGNSDSDVKRTTRQKRAATVLRVNPSTELCDFEAIPRRSSDHFLQMRCSGLRALQLIDAELDRLLSSSGSHDDNAVHNKEL
jgi:hypothetical protein